MLRKLISQSKATKRTAKAQRYWHNAKTEKNLTLISLLIWETSGSVQPEQDAKEKSKKKSSWSLKINKKLKKIEKAEESHLSMEKKR
jgi:hypothetical protein